MPLWSENRRRQSLSRSNDSLRFRHRPYAFDTSSVVPLRSSSCPSPDLVLSRPFSSCAHDHGFCPQPPEVVWNLLLQAGSEGPALIGQAVTHIGPSSALCARGALSSAYRAKRRPRRSNSRSSSSSTMFDSKGDRGPPCGVPSSVGLTSPPSITPARRKARISFNNLLSLTRSAIFAISLS